MRSWSVLRWPVALAAMSESTPSARPPSHSRKRSGASAIVEVHLPELHPLDRVHLQKVDAR